MTTQQQKGQPQRPVVAGPNRLAAAPKAMTPDQLMQVEREREFMLIGGKDGVGKTSAIVAIAAVVAGYVDDPSQHSMFNPDAVMHVLDTENRFAKAYRKFGAMAPQNISYYYCGDMDQTLLAFEVILKSIKPWDWLAVDSMARIWEMAQDLGYNEVSGMRKSEFLEKRRLAMDGGQKGGSPIPHPDQFWNIVKSAHDRHFLNVLVAREDINVVMTTIQTRAPRELPNRQENKDRKDFRTEFGIDSNMGGAPTLPYQPDTVVLLDREKGRVKAQVLKDTSPFNDDPRVEFWVPGFREFGVEFSKMCRMPPQA